MAASDSCSLNKTRFVNQTTILIYLQTAYREIVSQFLLRCSSSCKNIVDDANRLSTDCVFDLKHENKTVKMTLSTDILIAYFKCPPKNSFQCKD